MIDCCNAQLQIPKRDILLSFEHKRVDHIVFITKMVHIIFHETSAPKIARFSHFMLSHTCRMAFPILIFWT